MSKISSDSTLFQQALREALGVKRVRYPGIKLIVLSVSTLFAVAAVVVVMTMILHLWWNLIPVMTYETAFLLTAVFRISSAILALIGKSANTYATAAKRQADMQRGGKL